MSGLEVAGVVLGAFPIAIVGIQKLRDAARAIDLLKEDEIEYSKWLGELEFQQLCFKLHIKGLLLPMLVNQEQAEILMADPAGPSWRESRLMESLRLRLGEASAVYLQSMRGMQEALDGMATELSLSTQLIKKQMESRLVSRADALSTLSGTDAICFLAAHEEK